jgi:site-specific DNA recombinase
MERTKTPIRRCAIYTRKSSEEGLEQDFDSLHAQRGACEAFIRSQAGEGWRLVKTAYNDGGLSGGTMERPALQSLLSDINQGLIDVVVYKVDRLTRALTDFAKMVEVFDARGYLSSP